MILYYSGTGNSRFAAELIAEETGDSLVSMNELMRARRQNPNDAQYSFESERPLVIVSPTYCWRVPRVVEAFIRESRFEGCRDVYFFLTCGSDTALAEKYAERLCKELGFNFMGMSSAVMPENYIAMFNSPTYEKGEEIIEKAIPEIRSAGKAIASHIAIRDNHTGTGAKIFRSGMTPFFNTFWISDKKFFAKDSCIGCGKCADICPKVNITLEGSRPVWHGDCTHCMGCISICPTEAIEYGKVSTGKRRYYLSRDGKQKLPR